MNQETENRLNLLSLALDIARLEFETTPKKPRPIDVDVVINIAKKLEEFAVREVSVLSIKKTAARKANSILH